MKAQAVASNAAKRKPGNLFARLVSGAIGIPALVAIAWYGNPLLAAVVALVSFIAAI
jgi:hypothetical protein